MERKIFIFIGAPASGKGTRIEELVKCGWNSVSASILLKQAGVNVESGNLASDELIISLITDVLIKNDSNIILDGFPRTLTQAEALLNIENVNVDKVFYIVADEKLVIQRAMDRIICPVCQKNYSTSFRRPNVDRICDTCGNTLIKRKDDTQHIIEKRFRQFVETIDPIIDVFEKRHVQLVRIDAKLSPKEVLKYI